MQCVENGSEAKRQGAYRIAESGVGCCGRPSCMIMLTGWDEVEFVFVRVGAVVEVLRIISEETSGVLRACLRMMSIGSE